MITKRKKFFEGSIREFFSLPLNRAKEIKEAVVLNDTPITETLYQNICEACNGTSKCETCEGEGEVEHWCDCDLCDAGHEDCDYCDGTGTCPVCDGSGLAETPKAEATA